MSFSLREKMLLLEAVQFMQSSCDAPEIGGLIEKLKAEVRTEELPWTEVIRRRLEIVFAGAPDVRIGENVLAVEGLIVRKVDDAFDVGERGLHTRNYRYTLMGAIREITRHVVVRRLSE